MRADSRKLLISPSRWGRGYVAVVEFAGYADGVISLVPLEPLRRESRTAYAKRILMTIATIKVW